MMDTDLLPPSDVARRLEISGSTLRRWSAEFAPFLSDCAGRPDNSSQGESSHRRYTPEDLDVLASVARMLREGLTYRQIAGQLGNNGTSRINTNPDDVSAKALVTASAPHRAINPAFTLITDALGTLRESQESVLNSQQTNRDLLGVVIQDNFNLKEDNARLRDRMLHLERDVSELQRRNEQLRADLVERMADFESRSRPLRAGCLARLLGLA